MNAPTDGQVTPSKSMNIQTIMQDGKPAFVVIPFEDYQRLVQQSSAWIPDGDDIPNEVVKLTVSGLSQARAWREYLGLKQEDVAARMGITQPALAQIETAKRPRRATLEKLAVALGIRVGQLV